MVIKHDKSGLVVLPCFTNKHTLQSNMAWKIHHKKCAVAPGTSMKGLPDKTAAVKTLVTGTSWKPILSNSGSRCQRVGSCWIHGAPPFQNGAIMVLGSPTVQRNNNAAIDILLRYVYDCLCMFNLIPRILISKIQLFLVSVRQNKTAWFNLANMEVVGIPISNGQ